MRKVITMRKAANSTDMYYKINEDIYKNPLGLSDDHLFTIRSYYYDDNLMTDDQAVIEYKLQLMQAYRDQINKLSDLFDAVFNAKEEK